MKISTVLVIIFAVTAPFVVIPMVQPFWDDYEAAKRDCMDTKPENRTGAQKSKCKSGKGFIIPGVL